MARVLLFSYWPVFTPDGMACSVGLRVWGLARQLSARGHQVRIAEPGWGPSSRAPLDPSIEMVGSGDPRASRAMIEAADVVVVPAAPTMVSHFKHSRPRCLVVDLYAPILLEGASIMECTEAHMGIYAGLVRSVLFFLRRGDVFLCAGQRQRQFYIGALSAAGRLNALTDPDHLLRIVPMGTEPAPPVELAEPLLRGRWVAEDAELLLWPGGIYPWFDALTVVRALARLRRDRPRATLLFVGAENPLAGDLSSPGAREALHHAIQLGLPEDAVRFAPWLPHERRAAMYAEADLAVTAHKPLPEAEFSWRTRTLDCLWGGLPMVLTEGDELSDLARTGGAALCVPPGDDAAMAAALGALLQQPERRAVMRVAARRLATEILSWDHVIEPLQAICRDPRPSPDRGNPCLARVLDHTIVTLPPPAEQIRVWIDRAWGSLRYRGFFGAARHGSSELLAAARHVARADRGPEMEPEGSAG